MAGPAIADQSRATKDVRQQHAEDHKAGDADHRGDEPQKNRKRDPSAQPARQLPQASVKIHRGFSLPAIAVGISAIESSLRIIAAPGARDPRPRYHTGTFEFHESTNSTGSDTKQYHGCCQRVRLDRLGRRARVSRRCPSRVAARGRPRARPEPADGRPAARGIRSGRSAVRHCSTACPTVCASTPPARPARRPPSGSKARRWRLSGAASPASPDVERHRPGLGRRMGREPSRPPLRPRGRGRSAAGDHPRTRRVAANRQPRAPRRRSGAAPRRTREPAIWYITKVGAFAGALYRRRDGGEPGHGPQRGASWITYTEEQAHYVSARWLDQRLRNSGGRVVLRASNLAMRVEAIRAGVGIGLLPCYRRRQRPAPRARHRSGARARRRLLGHRPSRSAPGGLRARRHRLDPRHLRPPPRCARRRRRGRPDANRGACLRRIARAPPTDGRAPGENRLVAAGSDRSRNGRNCETARSTGRLRRLRLLYSCATDGAVPPRRPALLTKFQFEMQLRLFRHFVPVSVVLLVSLDALLITGAFYQMLSQSGGTTPLVFGVTTPSGPACRGLVGRRGRDHGLGRPLRRTELCRFPPAAQQDRRRLCARADAGAGLGHVLASGAPASARQQQPAAEGDVDLARLHLADPRRLSDHPRPRFAETAHRRPRQRHPGGAHRRSGQKRGKSTFRPGLVYPNAGRAWCCQQRQRRRLAGGRGRRARRSRLSARGQRDHRRHRRPARPAGAPAAALQARRDPRHRIPRFLGARDADGRSRGAAAELAVLFRRLSLRPL